MEELFTFDDAAAALGTSSRFIRALVANRKIRFVRVGRLIRIPESALAEYVKASTVEPITVSAAWKARRVG